MKENVSIVVTTYNRPEALNRAVQSAIMQTYSPIEIIVVDDAGEIPAKTTIKNKKVRIVRHKVNKGLAAARNTGWKKSKGKYVAFLDDDDEFLPIKIEKQVKLLDASGENYAFVYCGQKVFRPNGSYFIISPRHIGNIKDSIIRNDLSSISSTCLFKKNILNEIGGFDEDLKNNIDHDLWMTFAVNGYYCDFVDEPLTINYRTLGNNRLTTDLSNRIKEVEKFITKWSPIYEKWYKNNYRKRLTGYRTRVYTMLANDRMMKSDLMAGVKVYYALFAKQPFVVLLKLPLYIAYGVVLYILSLFFKVLSPHSRIRYY